jgi:predicted TIM-barrel fold metal-dependent hydrolase
MVALLLGWLDEEYEKRSPEAPLLKAKPSEYLKNGNWFCSTEPDEHALPYVIEQFGADMVLFASDYPHWDGLYPNAVSTLVKRNDISEQAKQKILADAKNLRLVSAVNVPLRTNIGSG